MVQTNLQINLSGSRTPSKKNKSQELLGRGKDEEDEEQKEKCNSENLIK